MRKVALITGSSRGIGRACAEALAKEGWAVCINCVERADLAAALCEKLRDGGADAIWVQADVADPEAVKAMVAKTEKELGKVTLLGPGICGKPRRLPQHDPGGAALDAA